MNRFSVLVCFLATLVFVPACAGSKVDTQDPVSGQSADGAKASGQKDVKEVAFRGLASTCEGGVVQWMQKPGGRLEVIAKDGGLWSFDLTAKSANYVRLLEGSPDDYALLPNDGVILHFSDKAMVEEAGSGMDYFVLASRPGSHEVHVGDDFQSIAMHSPEEARFNIWDASGQFTGISGGETVQEFLRRQSPDFSLGFPQEPTAFDLSNKRRAAVALDSAAENKQGLLYYMDEAREAGRLFNLGRTNSEVRVLDLSPDGEYLAVVDVSGRLYVTQTQNKGFKAWAQRVNDVVWIAWSGTDLVIGTKQGVVGVNPVDGQERWSMASNPYQRCESYLDGLFCASLTQLDRLERGGVLSTRIIVSGKKYAIIEAASQSGDLAAQCLE